MVETERMAGSPGRVFASLAGRILLYTAISGGVFFGLMSCGVQGVPLFFFGETGPVEILQTVLAMLAALIFLLAGRVDHTKAPCAVVLAAFIFCLVIREFDYFFDEYVFRHAWKIGVLLVLVSLTVYAIRNFREIGASLLEFTTLPSFGILLSGLLVLVVFSRLFGYGDFWEALFHDENCLATRQLVDAQTDNLVYIQLWDEKCLTIKRIVEETAEEIAYFLLLIASCEYLHAAGTRRRIGSAGSRHGVV